MSSVPQFGAVAPGQTFVDRPAVFGIAVRDGRIALVQVAKPGHPSWRDLPGGAIDPGEGPAEALVREFGEETGLKVWAGGEFARADQRFVTTEGQAYNNRGVFLEVQVVAEAPERKIEKDHQLVWVEPELALRQLRHEAHAWAVTAWLRRL